MSCGQLVEVRKRPGALSTRAKQSNREHAQIFLLKILRVNARRKARRSRSMTDAQATIGSASMSMGTGIVGGIIGGVQSRKNREWQTKQNNIERKRQDTAYQRAVADMQAAGLNPATLTGGAETSGANLTPSETINPMDSVQEGLSSAMEGITKKMERDFNRQQLENTKKMQQEELNLRHYQAETQRMNVDLTKQIVGALANGKGLETVLGDNKVSEVGNKVVEGTKNYYGEVADTGKKVMELITEPSFEKAKEVGKAALSNSLIGKAAKSKAGKTAIEKAKEIRNKIKAKIKK